MQKTIYICDQCNKTIGDAVHITLELPQGSYSGIAVPPEITVLPKWCVDRISGFKHFHMGCIQKYFEKLAKIYN